MKQYEIESEIRKFNALSSTINHLPGFHIAMEKTMPRYLMYKFGLLRWCGKRGKTRMTFEFDNDTGEGYGIIETEDKELLLSRGVQELLDEHDSLDY